MIAILLILASIAGTCGLLVGLIVWSFASLNTALVVGVAVSILTFVGLYYLAMMIVSERSPESAVEEMSDWLSSPLEYGKRPDSCEVIFDAEVPWPPDGTMERVFLCRYAFAGESDDSDGIGFAGPTTFSFLDLDWDAITHEELLQCYRGLYLAMLIQAADGEQDELTAKEWEQISTHLKAACFDTDDTKTEFGDSQTIRSADADLLFAIRVKKDGGDVIAVGDFGNLDLFETRNAEHFDVPLAHYHWIGSWWSAKHSHETAET